MRAMHPLPLVLRELYVAGRQPATFRLRMAFGAGGMGFTIWAFLAWGASHGNGRWIYHILLGLAALFAVVGGLLIAADSISRERREGTLGFLFLTDLHPADVVLGKFAAAALLPGTTLLAFFPGLALCQLLGGIPVGEFWRGILALIVTLFFALCATIFVSAQCEDHRKAHAGAALVLLVLNPLWLCLLSLEDTYRQVPLLYWLALPVFLVLGAVLLNSACTTLAAGWHDTADRGEKKSEAMPARTKAAQALLDLQPVAWMVLRRAAHARRAWFDRRMPIRCAALLLFAICAFADRGWGLLLIFAMHLAVYSIALVRASYSFYTDRQDGSLELLLGTRLAMPEVFRGFALALLENAMPLLITLSAMDICWAILLGFDGTKWFILPLALGATLWISVLGFGSTAVYRSLLSNNPALAMIASVLRLSLFPTLISAFSILAYPGSAMPIAGFWVVSSGFTALFFGIDARAALDKHGRELLLRPFSEKPPHIENEWSFIDWDESAESRPAFSPVPAQI